MNPRGPRPNGEVQIYGKNRITGASPVGLIRILYQEAVRTVDAARMALDNGDPVTRARSVTKAVAILTELMLDLNRDAAPEMADRLKQFYDYLQWRLLMGHAQRDAQAFTEVRTLLHSMEQAWEAVQTGVAARREGPPDSSLDSSLDVPQTGTAPAETSANPYANAANPDRRKLYI